MKQRVPTFQRHQYRGHEAVGANNTGYSDGSPSLRTGFPRSETADVRRRSYGSSVTCGQRPKTPEIEKLARLLWELADKLYDCRPHAVAAP